MVQPADMQHITITGSRTVLDDTVDTLHQLGVLHIDTYDEDHDQFTVGTPQETADTYAQLLHDLRHVTQMLPHSDATATDTEINGVQDVQDTIEEVQETVEHLRSKEERLAKEQEELQEQISLYRRIAATGVKPANIRDYDALTTHIGTVETLQPLQNLPQDRVHLNHDKNFIVFFADTALDTTDALQAAGFTPVDSTPVTASTQSLTELEQELQQVEDDLADTRAQLHAQADTHAAFLTAAQSWLRTQLEKAEAPLHFATSTRSFTAQGWIPADSVETVASTFQNRDAVHVETSSADENPPVKYDNADAVSQFEPFTDLMARPQYNEIDPTFLLAFTFPLLFGFMIGDAGYGLSSLLVFYAGKKQIPHASRVFTALMYCSAATIFFGLIFGDAFGYIIFGENSILTALTGIQLFQSIPILFHRAHHFTQVFHIAAVFGVIHVNLGLLLGMYNEYNRHGVKAALLEKGGWLLLEAAAITWYLTSAMYGLPVLAAAVTVLYLGEGVEGVVEIPSLLSNILSYLRVFGVAVAAVSLALVVNGIAQPLFAKGGIGILFGVLALLLGHTFNTFIKIMEGFLQGIRLHYVELFTKFFHGGGTAYNPFGSPSQ